MSTLRALPSQNIQTPDPEHPFVPEALYWAKYYEQPDIHYEWNQGCLEEKPVSDYLTYCMYAWLLALLEHFLAARPMAKVVGLEMGFRMTLPGFQFRKTDLNGRPPLASLRLDPVYHGFVLPGWQAETERRAAAELEVEAARQRARAAEDEAARLRADLARSILVLLGQRGFVVDEIFARRIGCCRDDEQLRRWLLAAARIERLDQLDEYGSH